MGAHTIVGILYSNMNKLSNVSNIIVQSNNHIEFLRKKITLIGYYIDNEKLVKDNDIIYTIISFKKGKKRYNRKELYFGPYLLKENSSLFKEKNKKDLEKLLFLESIIPKNHYLHRFKTKRKIKLYKNLDI